MCLTGGCLQQARDLEVTQQAKAGESTRFALQRLSPDDTKARVNDSIVRYASSLSFQCWFKSTTCQAGVDRSAYWFYSLYDISHCTELCDDTIEVYFE